MKTADSIYKFSDNDKMDFVAIKKVTSDGDPSAFSHLFNKYYRHVYYSILKNLGGNTASAEDIACIALERAFEKLHLYKVNKTFSTWLSTIVRNETNNYFRKQSRTVNTVSLDIQIGGDDNDDDRNASGATYDLGIDEPNPEQILIQEERKKTVHHAVGQLGKKSQDVVRLILFEGYPYAEAAEELELTLSDVKVTLFRAKKKIKKLLERKIEKGII